MSEEERIYEEQKLQWQDPIFRRMVKNACGSVCYNCGCKENIQYHHIVPLRLGGTNALSNIAALCTRCHKVAHMGQHINDYRNTENMGRPHNVPEKEMDSVFTEYINGRIGMKECKQLIEISKKSKITDMSYYKKFLKERGIKKVKNNIDIIEVKRGMVRNGDVVGYIEYEDGTLQTNKWVD